jgi:hypothetical protein
MAPALASFLPPLPWVKQGAPADCAAAPGAVLVTALVPAPVLDSEMSFHPHPPSEGSEHLLARAEASVVEEEVLATA